MSVIATEQLTKRYGHRIGIEQLDISVPDGAVFGFLGPNGSGKTTTIRVLLGLLKPNEGAACIFGLDCWRDSHRIKAEVGYLPGDLRLYGWLTCKQALRIFGQVRRRDLAVAGNELAEYAIAKGLPVILVGGLESVPGALVGGLIVGISELLGGGYIDELVGGGFREVTPFILMLLILLIRPFGIFGEERIERI